MSQNNDESNTMWDQRYQEVRVESSKAKLNQGQNCGEHIVNAVFKHLVHIFVIIICLSFIIMIGFVNQTNSGESFNDLWKGRIEQLNLAIKLHPTFYGIQKMGEAGGVNITDSLAKYLRKQMKEEVPVHHLGIFIHPLYAELQSNSPMGNMKPYNITIIDSAK